MVTVEKDQDIMCTRRLAVMDLPSKNISSVFQPFTNSGSTETTLSGGRLRSLCFGPWAVCLVQVSLSNKVNE